MKDKEVYFRTEKGQHEVAHRSRGLNSICRHVLILINGEISVGQLVRRAPDSWDIREKLTELESKGFISNGSTPVAISTAKSSADEVLNAQIEDLIPIKLALISAAEEVLGSSSAKVVERIRNCDDSDAGINQTIDSCVKLVTLIVSEKKAKALNQALHQVIEEVS